MAKEVGDTIFTKSELWCRVAVGRVETIRSVDLSAIGNVDLEPTGSDITSRPCQSRNRIRVVALKNRGDR